MLSIINGVIKINRKEIAKDLLDFIYESPTSFRQQKISAISCRKMVFMELRENEEWSLERNRKYYIRKNDSALIAFGLELMTRPGPVSASLLPILIPRLLKIETTTWSSVRGQLSQIEY